MTGGTPVEIPRTHLLTLESGDGAGYRILIAEPDGPAPEQGFPLLCALDGGSVFGTFVEAVRMRGRRPDATGVVPAVIVGVEHAGPTGAARLRRTLDFTAGPSVESGEAAPGAETGGAAAFLEFLEQQVLVEVRRVLPVDVRRQALFGHSLGGLFALWAFAQAQTSFDAYVAVSPSIWWNPEALSRQIASRPRSGHTPRVMLTVGEFEQARAPWQPDGARTEDALRRREARRMVDRVHEVAALIRSGGARVDCHAFAGEDHASVVTLSAARCLRFVFAAAGPRG